MFRLKKSLAKFSRSRLRVPTGVLALSLVIAAVGEAGQTSPVPHLPAARAADSLVPVIITLKDQPFSQVAQEVRPLYASRFQELNGRLQALDPAQAWDGVARTTKEEQEYVLSLPPPGARVAAQHTDVASQLDTLHDEMRAEIAHLARPMMEETQRDLVRIIEQAGGRVTYQVLVVNSLAAQVPADLIPGLEARSEVTEVSLDRLLHTHLNVSARTIFADTWWGHGTDGGAYDVGIIDSGVDPNHPALTGRVTGQRFGATADTWFSTDCPTFVPGTGAGATDPTADDVHGHGTHVAGIAASDDATRRGIAFGLDAVLNGKAAFLCPATGRAGMYWSDGAAAIDWTLTGLGIQHADAINLSYGGDAVVDDDDMERFLDAVVDDENILVTVSAGNDGPAANTIGSPSIAYNVLSVANMDDRDTFTHSDDIIRNSSSRGPTPGGRRKPDITAPGTDIWSANNNWEGGNPDFAERSGTSMSAPTVAGALVLLRDVGLSDPMRMKALLINTAEDFGSADWDATFGWGYIDLLHADYHFIHWPSSLFAGSIGESGAEEFYRGAMVDNETATLVWNRRVVYNGSSWPSTYYDLSNLNLRLYNDVNNALIDSSTSAIDNVEQVQANADYSQVVIKIDSVGTFDGASTEAYALATEEGFVASTGPVLSVSEGELTTGPEGDPVARVTVGNGGDLTAHSVRVTIGLPLEPESVEAATVDVGRLAPGEEQEVSWNLSPKQAVASGGIPVIVTSDSYGSTFQAQGEITAPNGGGVVYLPLMIRGR